MRTIPRKIPPLLVILALSAQVVMAQDAVPAQAPATPAEAESATPAVHPLNVTLALHAQVPTESSDIPVLPLDILDRLNNSEALISLEMLAQGGSFVQISAKYAFRDLEAFRAWFESDDAQAMLRQLDSSIGGDVRLSLNVNRPR